MLTPLECNQGKETSTIFKEQEEEKKRKYQQRVLDVEMGSFAPLVFGTNGWNGSRLQLLSQTPSREALRKQ